MNTRLKAFARKTIKEELALCEDKHRRFFKCLYGRGHGRNKRSLEKTLAMPIGDIVDEMHEHELDRAMEQVEQTLKKIAKQQ